MTAALERKLEVLELAQEHNFIVLEGKLIPTMPSPPVEPSV
jgi:hypothetical protein